MLLMNVFTAHTYFQGNEAEVAPSLSPHLYLPQFPLGSRHLALLLSEVVIYKHQFVSTDQGLAVVCQSD